jgi:hypothetical protein
MNKKEYNGWYNYETWLCNLWYDDAFSEDARQVWDDSDGDDTFSKKENATLALEDVIKSIVEETASEGIPESGFAADLINAALSEINYYEIAEHYIDDIADKHEDEEAA